MRNGRNTLCGILGIFFVLSVVLMASGQPAPSDSGVITVTEKIDVGELNRNVKDLSKDLKELSENLKELNKNVKELNTQFARLDERTKLNSNLLYILIAGVFGIPLTRVLWSNWNKRNRKSEEHIQGTAIHSQSKIPPTFDPEVLEFEPSYPDPGPKSNPMGGNPQ